MSFSGYWSLLMGLEQANAKLKFEEAHADLMKSLQDIELEQAEKKACEALHNIGDILGKRGDGDNQPTD